jgi:hypothetical protein
MTHDDIDTRIEERYVIDAIDQFFGPEDPSALTDNGFKNPMYEAYAALARRRRPTFRTTAIRQRLGELGIMLAGGAVTSAFSGAPVNDLDFYIKDASKIAEAKEFLSVWFPEIPYQTANAITFQRKAANSRKKWTVQLITRFTGEPSEIFSTFDFTITQGLYDFDINDFVLGSRFIQDLAAKKLVYLGGSRFPICAMYRTKKYQNRGFTLPGATVMHIALSIVQLNIKTYADLKEQLMGVDTMYLSGILNNSTKYSDDLPVDYGVFLVDAFDALDGFSYGEDELN